MIVKKVENPDKGSSKATRIKYLCAYILDPGRTNVGEKCVYAGSRGFICDDYQSQIAEMVALSSEAVRSPDTITHYILSWREGEQPTGENIEQAMDLLLAELGLDHHQVIYGMHADTDNLHLHVAVNRVHPETGKVITPNKGFDIEAAHRAVARIEEAQGWSREVNARYSVADDGRTVRRDTVNGQPRQPSQRARDAEIRTGTKSAERVAIEDAWPIISAATSWSELHSNLAAAGMRYEKSGSGAVIWVGDTAVKASAADPKASLGKLQKRLGEYQPCGVAAPGRGFEDEEDATEQDMQPAQPLRPNVEGWGEYQRSRRLHFQNKRFEAGELRSLRDQERAALSSAKKAEFDSLRDEKWVKRGAALNAQRNLLALRYKALELALRDKHSQLGVGLAKKYQPFPTFEQWQRTEFGDDAGEAWRYEFGIRCGLHATFLVVPLCYQIGQFDARQVGKKVQYFASTVATDVAFIDNGRSIDVVDSDSDEACLAALLLAQNKWGGATLRGPDEYQVRCLRLAAEHGIRVNNSELHVLMDEMRVEANIRVQRREFGRDDYEYEARCNELAKEHGLRVASPDTEIREVRRYEERDRGSGQDYSR